MRNRVNGWWAAAGYWSNLRISDGTWELEDFQRKTKSYTAEVAEKVRRKERKENQILMHTDFSSLALTF